MCKVAEWPETLAASDSFGYSDRCIIPGRQHQGIEQIFQATFRSPEMNKWHRLLLNEFRSHVHTLYFSDQLRPCHRGTSLGEILVEATLFTQVIFGMTEVIFGRAWFAIDGIL